MNGIFLIIATYLASAMESIEMMAIVVGVGATRGWRSTLIGAATGLAVLGAIVVSLRMALTAIPIDWLRLVVGALLLIFGLQWLKKGIVRLGIPRPPHESDEVKSRRSAQSRPQAQGAMDWYAFVLAFKGVLLEGLEIAFIVVTFGAGARQIGLASIGAVAAFLTAAGVSFVMREWLARIPRNWLRFAVGVLLTTFGVFWAAEGAGAEWPGDEWSLLALLAVMAAVSFGLLELLKTGNVPRTSAETFR